MSLFAAPSPIITSLRLTPTDVILLSLDTKQQKIVNLYQQALPAGVIVKGVVLDGPQLASILKVVLEKSRCLGQEIIIGFPEDRTLLGMADVTNIPKEKLAQAINWQIEEIFPTAPDELYVDWLIADTPLPHQKALVVATPKKTIDGLIASVIQAGGKPISCEPTSISLAKLVPAGSVSVIAEIRKYHSTIILTDVAKNVRLSTIVSEPTLLVSELYRMLRFYEQKYQEKVQTIYICGEGATPEWISFMQEQIKIPAQALPLPPITNIPPPALRFAVSLALAQGPIMPSQHWATINLLPANLELEYEHQVEKKQLSFGYKASVITTLITAAIMALAFVRIHLSLAAVKTQTTAQEQLISQTSYDQLAKQAEAANAQARVLQRLPAKDNLSAIIQALHTALPTPVTINAYTINLREHVTLVNGFAPTRDNLLTFKSNLEASPVFNLVTIPLPTLERKQDVEFSIAIDIAKTK